MALRTTVSCKAVSRAAGPSRGAVVCRASAEPASRRQLLGLGLGALALVAAAPAKADIVAELLEKSAANKALNDKKRLATSSANVARARTVTDGTCGFPTNFFGCEDGSAKFTGGVKFIQDDLDLECEGTSTGRCQSKVNHKYGAKGF